MGFSYPFAVQGGLFGNAMRAETIPSGIKRAKNRPKWRQALPFTHKLAFSELDILSGIKPS
jgi:hypothetical protein